MPNVLKKVYLYRTQKIRILVNTSRIKEVVEKQHQDHSGSSSWALELRGWVCGGGEEENTVTLHPNHKC